MDESDWLWTDQTFPMRRGDQPPNFLLLSNSYAATITIVPLEGGTGMHPDSDWKGALLINRGWIDRCPTPARLPEPFHRVVEISTPLSLVSGRH